MSIPSNPFWLHLAKTEFEIGAQVYGIDLPTPVWIIEADWQELPLISRIGGEVRIVLVLAAKRRCGAFRRLVDGIIAAGLRPVVVCPVLADMPRILAHWRWVCRSVGFRDEWRPPAEKQEIAA